METKLQIEKPSNIEVIPDHAESEEVRNKIRQKCERFNAWCKQVGIICPKIEYPAFFEGGLVGGKVTAPIEHREAFLCIPYNVIISIDKCVKDPVLKQFYGENSQLFTKVHRDWEQLILTTYLMYQKQLGDKSFWAPYIELMPDVTFFCDLERKEIMTTMDPFLVSEAIQYREELQDEWIEVLEVLKRYPTLFNEQTCQRKNFMSLYAQVCSRCFGWGIPFTSMIPMADNFNHADVDTTCEIVTKSLHKQADEDSTYFTKSKFMNDYSNVFTPEEIEQF